MMITRREAIRHTLLATAACALAKPALTLAADAPAGPFKLPPLPYAFDALEPHIDARTMEIHHGKHHAGYVNNLNAALTRAPSLAGKSIEDLLGDLGSLPESVRTAIRNNGGGHSNHTLFWQMLKKGGGGQPKGALAKALDAKFGGFDQFKQAFTTAATTVFGSGWAWLTLKGGELHLEQTPNQDTPLSQGSRPLLGIDVWEHAYYLKYQNRRPEYVAAFFNVVNWDFVAGRYNELKG